MRFVFIITALCFATNSFSQQKELDSLINLYNVEKTDSIKVTLLEKLYYKTIFQNETKALTYIDSLIIIGERIPLGLYAAHYNKAFYYYNKTQYDSVIFSLKEALPYAKTLKDYRKQAELNSKIALTFYSLKNNNDSVEYYNQVALKISKENKFHFQEAQVYYNLGALYRDQQKFDKAIEYFIKIDSLPEDDKLIKTMKGSSFQDAGNLFIEIKEYKKARKYFEKAKKLYAEFNEEDNINELIRLIAVVDYHEGNYEEALKKHKQIEPYYTNISSKRALSNYKQSLANIYIKLQRTNEAIELLEETLQIKKELKTGVPSILNTLGKLYYDKGKMDKSRRYLEESLNYSEKIYNAEFKMEALQLLSEINFKTKKEAIAYKQLKDHMKLKDSILHIRNLAKANDLETKYQTEKKEQEITLLTTQKQLVERQKINQRNLFLGGLALVLLASGFLYFQYRNRQKTNKKLQELDKAKSTFFANISHEFRTPLTLIKGPIEDQLTLNTLSSNQRKNLLSAQKNTKRLENLVDQLLALSKLESGNLKLQVQPGNLAQFLKAQAEAFQFVSQEKQLQFNIAIYNNEETHWFDRDALQKILFNLIGNAFKYTPEQGKIEIFGNRFQNHYKITTSNSNTYLTPQQQAAIFTRFYQTNVYNAGTGIGLALTKELTELHKGKITVQSSQEQGTSFMVTIPIVKNYYQPSEILTEAFHKPIEEPFLSSEIAIESATTMPLEDAPILLIIDDNEDIRTYVSSIFENEYQIITATNGKEGLENAITNIPDAIISDVMMPEKDGFSLTKLLKENELTSHIPIVLLTAKIEDKDKLEGLTSGADTYITKPFNSQFLKVTLQNLLENRRKIQERFSKEVILTPKEIAISSADEQFLERLQNILGKQLTNPNFSIQSFAREMSVSRMQLHRKLKAISGKSTSEFIRTERLKLAANLIKNDKISSTEAGYTVGFNEPSYFSKCFKKEFGCSPSQYAKK